MKTLWIILIVGIVLIEVIIGATSPGTGTDDDSIGTVTWSSPENILVNDGSDAQALDVSGEVQTHYLKGTNFSFIIPEGATIDGIVAEIERNSPSSSDTYDYEVKIVKSNGSIGTENKADTDTEWPSSATYKTYGANDDLWSESWEYTDINDEDFGFVLSADMRALGLVAATVDHFRITVYYTLPSARESPRFLIKQTSKFTIKSNGEFIMKK